MMGYGYGMMGLGIIIPLLLIGLVIYEVVKISQSSNMNNQPRRRTDALDILNERYAKGEISEEEYTKMKKALRD